MIQYTIIAAARVARNRRIKTSGGNGGRDPIVRSFQARSMVPILPPLLTMVSTLSNEESVSFAGAEGLSISVP